jgi:RNA polymerase sigma factor (sigma-70 family)
MHPQPTVSLTSDERLIQECLKGNEEAWAALLNKYRNLIYSIPLKCGLTHDDAKDIFQQACVQLLRRLGDLRDVKTLPAWLMKVTTNLSFHWISKEQRFEPAAADIDWGRAPEIPDQLLRELEKEQLFREAMARLTPRCRELLRMLFFENPPVPYADAASRLGLATGSIGFIRMRCLRGLRKELEVGGFL